MFEVFSSKNGSDSKDGITVEQSLNQQSGSSRQHAGSQCDAANLRHGAREVLYCNYRVFDMDTNKVAGYINDISLDGARLMTEELVGRGECRRFRIDLPKRSADDGSYRSKTSIYLEAISTWTTDDGRTSFFECGFRFLNLNSKTKILLSELIHDCHR